MATWSNSFSPNELCKHFIANFQQNTLWNLKFLRKIKIFTDDAEKKNEWEKKSLYECTTFFHRIKCTQPIQTFTRKSAWHNIRNLISTIQNYEIQRQKSHANPNSIIFNTEGKSKISVHVYTRTNFLQCGFRMLNQDWRLKLGQECQQQGLIPATRAIF